MSCEREHTKPVVRINGQPAVIPLTWLTAVQWRVPAPDGFEAVGALQMSEPFSVCMNGVWVRGEKGDYLIRSRDNRYSIVKFGRFNQFLTRVPQGAYAKE